MQHGASELFPVLDPKIPKNVLPIALILLPRNHNKRQNHLLRFRRHLGILSKLMIDSLKISRAEPCPRPMLICLPSPLNCAEEAAQPLSTPGMSGYALRANFDVSRTP